VFHSGRRAGQKTSSAIAKERLNLLMKELEIIPNVPILALEKENARRIQFEGKTTYPN